MNGNEPLNKLHERVAALIPADAGLQQDPGALLRKDSDGSEAAKVLELELAMTRRLYHLAANMLRAINCAHAAAVGAQEVAAMFATDVIQLASLVQTVDPMEAELVRGAVERARRVLGPEPDGRH